MQYFNSTKGGRDDMDQKVRYYSIKRMTSKWPMAVLFVQQDRYKRIDCHNYMNGTSNLSAMPERCPLCLLITLKKLFARITTNYNPTIQRPASSQSCIA